MTQTAFEKLTFEIAGIYSRRDARLVEEHIEEARKHNQINEEQYKVLSTLWNLKDYEAEYMIRN